MSVRKVIHIDEDLCDGCGLCAPSCAEGAIEVIDGKARLVSEVYCDGLGACLGECPRGAIRIDEREAEEFDQAQVDRRLEHLRAEGRETPAPAPAHASHPAPGPGAARDPVAPAGGCPSAAVRSFAPSHAPPAPAGTEAAAGAAARRPTALGHWPVKIALVPPKAPFLRGADLVVAADCAPFACADFHESILAGKAVVIGCPKLDDPEAHRGKLAAIFREAGLKSVQVVHMEVPCCFGLVHIVRQAIEDAGVSLVLTEKVVTVRGEHGEPTRAGEGHDLLRRQVASARR